MEKIARNPRLGTATLLAWAFFCLGFFTVTWDLVARVELGGKTFKLHQLLFFLSFATVLFSTPRAFLSVLREPGRWFLYFFLALIAYNLARAPFGFYPEKSALYACWTLFNLGTIWFTFQVLAPQVGGDRFLRLLVATVGFLSAVVIADQIAYQYGYTGGWIGFNQDQILKWGVSRPHAFANEPSYLATFLTIGLVPIGACIIGSRKRWMMIAPFLAGVLALTFTTSRTGWLGFALSGLLVFALASLRSQKIHWRPLAMLVLPLICAFFVLWIATPKKQMDRLRESLVDSVLRGADGSGNSRLRAHLDAVQMARETNFLGTGQGASYRYWMTRDDPVARANFPPERFGDEGIMSIWGQLLAEGGIASVLLFASALLSLIFVLGGHWRAAGSPLPLGTLASASVFFFFIAFWIGNIARGDVWVWYALWSAVASGRLPTAEDKS